MTYKRLKPFNELLDSHTRLDMLKAGMVTAMHDKYGSFDNFTKQAFVGDTFNALTGAGKLLLALSVVAGVPIGYGLHKADYATSPKRLSEREAKDRINFYRGLTSNIESELANKEKENAKSINVQDTEPKRIQYGTNA